jgi:hypothetical protein
MSLPIDGASAGRVSVEYSRPGGEPGARRHSDRRRERRFHAGRVAAGGTRGSAGADGTPRQRRRPAAALPPPGPIAGPGWKGFYSPPAPQAEGAKEDSPVARPDNGAPIDARVTPSGVHSHDDSPARRARVPDPLAGSIGTEGGWFSDAMLDALAKYESAKRLREPQPPEAVRSGSVNLVN